MHSSVRRLDNSALVYLTMMKSWTIISTERKYFWMISRLEPVEDEDVVDRYFIDEDLITPTITKDLYCVSLYVRH